MYGFVLAILILVSIILGIAILLQAGTGGGLAAMGGGAASESFLGGRQATTILTKASWWLGGTFLGLSMLLAGMSTDASGPRSVLEGQQPTIPMPLAPPPTLPLETGNDGTPPPDAEQPPSSENPSPGN